MQAGPPWERMEENAMKKYIPMIAMNLTVAFCSLILGVCLVGAQGKAELYMTDAAGKVRLQQLQVAISGKQTVRLMANVPDSKVLKAYKVSLAKANAPEAPLAPKYVNADKPGLITINSFDVTGAKGNAIPLCDFTISGKTAGFFQLIIAPNSFGASAADTFIPITDTIEVNVQ